MTIFKFLSFFILLLFSSALLSMSEFCPSVEEIKQGNFHTWIPLYITGEEEAMPNDVEKFKQHVSKFTIARWNRVFLENGHCFYEGSAAIVSNIVFAHDAWRPLNNNPWHWLNPENLAECYDSDVKNCEFIL